jgi:class 3 adenylate cyclase
MPQTQYARSGDVSIAYQVSGGGPFDIVFVPPSFSHVELAWGAPSLRKLFERLGSLGRLIRFDKRGTGMSDRGVEVADLETRMDDVRAVMDAAGSERAAIFGLSEGVAMSALFAATYPDRTWALVLCGGYARTLRAPDYPWGLTESESLQVITESQVRAEEADYPERLARSGCPAGGDEEIAAIAQMFRHSGSPGARVALARMNAQIDVREALSAIRTPALVLHNAGDTWVPPEVGRDLAARIPGATFVELPIEGHISPAADVELVVAAAEPFLQSSWLSARFDEEPDRVLATVLFTDIVDSTARMAELGDRGWRELLERHHALVRRELARARGREVDTAGDGFFASFDGPARAIRCAKSIVDGVGELGIEVRSGLHTGECELVDGKVTGIAVHTGARVAAQAGPGEVLVSQTVKDLVAGSSLQFEDRGAHELKGVPGEWRLYAAV